MNSPNYYEDGFALLIGIKYETWAQPLQGPLRDIAALKDHFEDSTKAAYNPKNVIVLTEQNATTAGILQALDDLAERCSNNPDASVTIYYSGHGGTMEGKYFILPYDFSMNDWQKGILDESKVIQTKEFAGKINLIIAKKCMVILDCCHAENIPVEKSFQNQSAFLNEFVDSLDSSIENPIMHKDISDGIKKGSGRVILTSCRARETSLDLGKLSLFTKVLLESLNGMSNIECDGWVRLIDLIRYVPKTVSAEALKYNNGHHQNPMFKRIEDLSSEDFVICAYDLAKTKRIAVSDSLTSSSNELDTAEFYRLIDDGLFADVFILLDKQKFGTQLQYNRLKKEFSAGLKGIDLIDFGDRLKVFINHSLEK